MKDYKIGFLSDTHLDFYITETNPNNKKLGKQVKRFIDDLLKPEGGDILLVAGDIGHYENQNKELLIQLSLHYNTVLFVSGNHELYLINNNHQEKYNYTSINRLEEMREWSFNQTNIHFLEGNVININGLKIGGYGNWYDLPTDDDLTEWREIMNDSNLIMTNHKPYIQYYGYGGRIKLTTFDTQAYRRENEKQLDKIVEEKCDILMCHIIPCIIPDHLKFRGHVGNSANRFYETDDFEKVKETGCEIVVYGHDHSNKEWFLDDIEFKTNSVSYPSEVGFKQIEHFTYIKEK